MGVRIMTLTSRRMLDLSTAVWALLMLVAGILIGSGVKVCDHFSFEVLLEFARAVTVWYIISVICSCAVDISSKKRR